MKNDLSHSAHTVGESNLHLQFTPAYRQDIFADPLVRELTIAYLLEKAKEMEVFLSAIDCGPDHIHLFVENWKSWSISDARSSLPELVQCGSGSLRTAITPQFLAITG